MHATEADGSWPAAIETPDRADAFRRLAESHLDDAYRLANAILGSPVEARDAVHDAFIAAWQAWPMLREPSRFAAWFRRIVVNACRDRLRRSSRWRRIDHGAALYTPDASDHVHDRLLIEAGLAHLKPDDRVLPALRFYRDLKVDDIAAVLDIPAGTVKSRLHHAQARLRTVIGRIETRSRSR